MQEESAVVANEPIPARMPKTRYQGSKRKLAGWIGDCLSGESFDTVLDAFGGTGAVAFELKRRGKTVTYNDILKFNHQIGLALVENATERLSAGDIDTMVQPSPDRDYDNTIERVFGDIYFTDAENRWIDIVAQNIRRQGHPLRRAIGFYALFQASLIKRPYNLFHRRNLYMRTANVARSFGNKVTWDRPFDVYFHRFVAEANAAVFDNGRPCRATRCDALQIEGHFDLVYIDTPYVSARGASVKYREFYHFLEGLVDYDTWVDRIDWDSKHRRLRPVPDVWSSARTLPGAMEQLLERFAESILVVSYRRDGVPSIEELERMLRRIKGNVRVVHQDGYQYALSTNKRSGEVLLIAT